MRVMIAVLRTSANVSYQSKSGWSAQPVSFSYCATVPSRSGNPSTRRPNRVDIVVASAVNQATSCSRDPIVAMSQSSTARGRRSSPNTTLPKRTSPQHRTRGSLGLRSGTCARHHWSASARARTGEPPDDHSRYSAQWSSSAASSRTGTPPAAAGPVAAPWMHPSVRTNCSCSSACAGDPGGADPRVEGGGLADDVAVDTRHHHERRAEPRRIGLDDDRGRDRHAGGRRGLLRGLLGDEVVVGEEPGRRRRHAQDEVLDHRFGSFPSGAEQDRHAGVPDGGSLQLVDRHAIDAVPVRQPSREAGGERRVGRAHA